MAFDDLTGLSAIMKTFRRDPAEDAKTHSLHAPMMPLLHPDPVLNFPAGTNLEPQLLLRNATASALPATLTLDWLNGSQSGHLALGSVTLSPGEVRQLALSDLIGAPPSSPLPKDAFWGTITVNYSGLGGDLVPIAMAFDASGRYGLQTPFDETKGKLFKGSMWHVDANRNSLITAGNAGPAGTRAALTIFYNAGKGRYTIEKYLNAGEQLWADLGQIIHNQLPDKDGNLIPIGTTMGSYELRDVDHHALGQIYEGKLVLDKTWGHGYYGCANCCGDGNFVFAPGLFVNFTGVGTGDEIDATNTCNNTTDDFTFDAYNWASGDTTIATVQGAWTQLVGMGSTRGSAAVDYTKNDKYHNCPTATATPSGEIDAGQKMDFANGSCTTASPAGPPTLGGTWINTDSVCLLSDTQLLGYSGGKCITQNNNSGCYQVSTSSHCLTSCVSQKPRTGDNACTRFLDTMAVIDVNFDYACPP